jgi:Asp-tRNA(Asn)/Glu-tRNA(Gln) amidotransferase A subunit family amidase
LTDPVITAEIRHSLADAVERIRMGADIIEVDGSAFVEMRGTFNDIILYEAWQVHHGQVERDPNHYGPETLRLLRTASMITREAYDAAIAKRALLMPATDAVYANVDVVMTPAAPYVAPETTPPIDTPEGEIEGLFTSVFNLTGAPAIVLPCGVNDAGLPIGLQLSSPRGSDMVLLRVAAEIEKLLGVERMKPAIS